MSAKSKIYTTKNKGFEIFFNIPVLLYHSKILMYSIKSLYETKSEKQICTYVFQFIEKITMRTI